RRRNRPGNAQANGPREHSDAGKPVFRPRRRSKGAPDRVAGISQASGQRGREDGGAFRLHTRLCPPATQKADDMTDQALKTTPLNAAHRALGARMVGFSGYDMPVQYEGVLAEHRWTREHAGIFD